MSSLHLVCFHHRDKAGQDIGTQCGCDILSDELLELYGNAHLAHISSTSTAMDVAVFEEEFFYAAHCAVTAHTAVLSHVGQTQQLKTAAQIRSRR